MNKPQWSKNKPDRPGIWASSNSGTAINSVFHLTQAPKNAHWAYDYYAFICDLPEIAEPGPELKPCKVCGGKPSVRKNSDGGFWYECSKEIPSELSGYISHSVCSRTRGLEVDAAKLWNEVNK